MGGKWPPCSPSGLCQASQEEGEVVGEGLRALGRQPDRKKQERRAGRRKGGGWGEGKGKGNPEHQAEDEGGRVPDLRRLTGDLGSSTQEQETL